MYELKRDAIWMNRHRALDYCLSMIFSENRCTFFRIVLKSIHPARTAGVPELAELRCLRWMEQSVGF